MKYGHRQQPSGGRLCWLWLHLHGCGHQYLVHVSVQAQLLLLHQLNQLPTLLGRHLRHQTDMVPLSVKGRCCNMDLLCAASLPCASDNAP